MKADAIVYSSNTGFTAKYADILGEKTSLPVYTIDEAEKSLPSGTDIIYLGWVFAGRIKDWNRAAAKYRVKAVCAVGIGSGTDSAEVIRENMQFKKELPLFAIPGGLDIKKLRGMNRFIISRIRGSAVKRLSKMKNLAESDLITLTLLKSGGNAVNEKFLQPLLALLEDER